LGHARKMDGLDITITEAPAHLADYRSTRRRNPLGSRLKRHARLISFLLIVVLPTLLTSIYFIAFAAVQYVSEAKFVVRGPAAQSQGTLTSLLQTAGMSRAPDDTYAVQDYIMSRDALSELIKSQGIRQVFSRPEADPLSRFPLFMRGNTFEHFFDYYQKHVDVILDATTGVSTLTVKAFRPEDSQRIALALLSGAEGLINRMNERQRENAMHDARNEVGLAEDRVQHIAAQIAEFRNREALLDPNKQSIPMLQSINELQTMLSRTNLQLSQLLVSSPHSPMIADYQHRIAALQTQIDDAKTKITGTDRSLVPKITAYDMLSLQREFADKQLASAISSLETARMQAEHQQLYLDAIVHPNLADYAAYPKRIASIAVVFATMLGIYLMGALLLAGAQEHRIV
jgi:capsular polysaccharide transport system permease protein